MSELSLVHTVALPAPGANPVGTRPPLLVLLHGVGSNERSMSRFAAAFDERFVVVSARSPLTLGSDSYAWFHVSFTAQGPVIVGEEAESGWKLLARFIDEAVEAYGVDPLRVYLAGFSQGAIMSLAGLLTSPERIAGVVAMSGRLLPEVLPHAVAPQRLADKKTLIIHGVNDDKLGIEFARSAREQLARFPLRLDYRELPMGHTVTEQSLAVATSWLSAALDAVG